MSRTSPSVTEPLSTVRRAGLRRVAMAVVAVAGVTFTVPAVTATAAFAMGAHSAQTGTCYPAGQDDGLTGCGPELATTVSPTTVAYGQGASVTDVAELDSEDYIHPANLGLVSFFICGPGATTCDASSGTLLASKSLTPFVDVPGHGDAAADDSDDSTSTLAFTPTNAGTYCFFAVFNGPVLHNDQRTLSEYAPDSHECFTVTPAPLTITASSGTFPLGGTPPAITPSYSGFVNGDTAATALTTSPTCQTTATSLSPIGTYPSWCSGAAAPNYTITYVPGTVTVTGAPPTAAGSGGSGPKTGSGKATATTPAGPTVVPNATIVHTGEPWAGAQPVELGAGGVGIGLLTMGIRRRRRFRLASLWGRQG